MKSPARILALLLVLAASSLMGQAPAITLQPLSKTVDAGTSLILSVRADGDTPLAYAWYREQTLLEGYTDRTLIISPVTLADAGSYHVVVSNAYGSETSNAALVEVVSEPIIQSQTTTITVEPGEPVMMEVVADGYPEPSYQWRFNGETIVGATEATYEIPAAQFGDIGRYEVVVSNAEGSITSDPVGVSVLGDTFVEEVMGIYGGNDVLPVDVPIHLSFSEPVVPGISGKIAVHSLDGTVVSEVDMAVEPYLREIGGEDYVHFPVLTSGKEAWIFLPPGALHSDSTYYVTIGDGVLQAESGGSVPGILDDQAIRFSTRPAPITGEGFVTVSADGSGDFATIQGAIEFAPANNPDRFHIFVRNGLYRELLHIPGEKPNITLEGESTDGVVVAYLNNANRNSGNARATFWMEGDQFILSRMSFVNTTPKGGSQAETLNSRARRTIVRDCGFYSYQDTLRMDGPIRFFRCYIEGDVDFMWGAGPAYYEECVIHSVNRGYLTQVRNNSGSHGFVYVDCVLTGEAQAENSYLSRIDQDVYPGSEAVFIDCAMGDHIASAGWLLNGTGATGELHFYEHGSLDLSGDSLDLSGRMDAATIIDASLASQYRDPAFVLDWESTVSLYLAGLSRRDTSDWRLHPAFGWIWVPGLSRNTSGFMAYAVDHDVWMHVTPLDGAAAMVYLFGVEGKGWYGHHLDAGNYLWNFAGSQWQLMDSL